MERFYHVSETPIYELVQWHTLSMTWVATTTTTSTANARPDGQSVCCKVRVTVSGGFLFDAHRR